MTERLGRMSKPDHIYTLVNFLSLHILRLCFFHAAMNRLFVFFEMPHGGMVRWRGAEIIRIGLAISQCHVATHNQLLPSKH